MKLSPEELAEIRGRNSAFQADLDAGEVWLGKTQEHHDRAALLAHIEAITPDDCVWTYDKDDDAYETGCGKRWQFYDGGPAENNVSFCHNCAGRVVVESPEVSDE